ncbi:MAG: hypothetical protein QG622_1868 [Actinomycetota bacterium]|nr:hypothetical protein [Actinomycetota bacterium]
MAVAVSPDQAAPSSGVTADGVTADRATDDGVTRFSTLWAQTLVDGGTVAGTVAEVTGELEPIALRLAGALAEDAGTAIGHEIATALADLGYPLTEIVASTVTVLLGDAVLLTGHDTGRLRALIGAVAEGLAKVASERTLAEQEERQQATLTAVRASEVNRRTTEARFLALFEQTAAGIGIATTSGYVIEGNAAWAAMLGCTPEEMRGRKVMDLVGPGGSPEVLTRYREMLAGECDQFRIEATHRSLDGRTMDLDLSISRVRGDDPAQDFVVGVAIDITERKKLQNRLWYEARHDALTGLPNRTLFLERLAGLLAGPRPPVQFGLCYLDLDSFKSVNDGLGHEVGDRLLIRVADRLREATAGSGGLLARLGGDEFGVLVEGCATLNQVADQVLASLVPPFVIDGRELTVSASVGVVDTVTATPEADALMQAADISLYLAKSRGRGRWERHDPRRNALQVTRATLATEMSSALARGEFFLEYQPLVSLDDGRVRRVEALVRWRHPRLGLLQPDEFIEIAEESGHIVPLGGWVLRTACQQAHEWHHRFPDAEVGVNVNVAVGQLYDPHLLDYVRDTLEETDLPSRLLHLELTESAVLGDTHGPLTVLTGLAATGVRFAIDDFGTGYSNLVRLGRLPACELKIAGSFLQRTPGDEPVNDKILPAIISLAHSLGLTVTAEGVETRPQAERLRLLGCDAAQGWFFGRPLPSDEITRLIAEPSPSVF